MGKCAVLKIFCVELNNETDEKTFEFLMSFCSENKRNQILKRRIKADRDRSAVGNALAKYAIKEVFSIPFKNQKFLYTKNKKPYLSDYKNIFFSISHSEKLVVCAVSDNPVGIDAEKERACSPGLTEVLEAKNCDEFLAVWTKKEAEIKKRGGKISYNNLKDIDISKTETFVYKDYYISVSN